MKKKIANWGNYPAIESEEYSFSSVRALQEAVLRDHAACIARGNGRCYGDASLGEKTISCLSFDHAISFNVKEGIFECESGVTLDQVLDIVVPKGWFLPVRQALNILRSAGR